MSYQRGACGVNRVIVKNNASVYGRFVMSSEVEGIMYGVVEGVKCITLRLFGHL